MSKMTFQYTDADDCVSGDHPRTITHEIANIETWPEILDQFYDFLKGLGFMLNPHDSLVVQSLESNKKTSSCDGECNSCNCK